MIKEVLKHVFFYSGYSGGTCFGCQLLILIWKRIYLSSRNGLHSRENTRFCHKCFSRLILKSFKDEVIIKTFLAVCFKLPWFNLYHGLTSTKSRYVYNRGNMVQKGQIVTMAWTFRYQTSRKYSNFLHESQNKRKAKRNFCLHLLEQYLIPFMLSPLG